MTTEYKLPDPAYCPYVNFDGRIKYIPYYTADTLRTEIAAAEKRGAEAMREKCAAAVKSEPAGLMSCDALGGPCEPYIPKWRAAEAIKEIEA